MVAINRHLDEAVEATRDALTRALSGDLRELRLELLLKVVAEGPEVCPLLAFFLVSSAVSSVSCWFY